MSKSLRTVCRTKYQRHPLWPCAALAVGLALAFSASAAPIVDQANGPANVVVGSPLSVSHDLTNRYGVGIDSIVTAELKVVVTDDNGNEDYSISFGSAPQFYSYTANIDGITEFVYPIAGTSLADLSTSGVLDVHIAATSCNGSKCGDYALRFVSSTLSVDVAPRNSLDPATNGVPEPGSLTLLGLGLAGLATWRRRGRR